MLDLSIVYRDIVSGILSFVFTEMLKLGMFLHLCLSLSLSAAQIKKTIFISLLLTSLLSQSEPSIYSRGRKLSPHWTISANQNSDPAVMLNVRNSE